MIPLLLKETRALAPWWVGAAAILAVAVVSAMVSETFLLQPLGARYDYAIGAPWWPSMYALLLGHGLVAHEVVHGQVKFLDGLPTTRGRVFLAKVIAGMLPCAVLVAGSAVMDVWLEQLAPVPFGGTGLRAIVLGHIAALCTLWFLLGLGMLLSWLRGLAMGAVLALLLVGGMVMEIWPAWGPWVPLPGADYASIHYNGAVPELDLVPALSWAAVGIFCMAVSHMLFRGVGEVVLRAGAWTGRALRFMGLGLAALGVLAMGGTGLTRLATWLPAVEEIRTERLGTLRTLYYADDESYVLDTMSDAPAQLAEVTELLDSDGPMPVIDVEFLGAARNHGGVFTGGKVRVRRNAEPYVLVHELAHVVAHQVSGAERLHDDHHVRFFNEGLATWVAAEVIGQPQLPPEVGWLYRMDQARFDLLVEDHLFQAEQDLAQVYLLGQVFVDAWVDEGGPHALGCALRSIGERAPGSKAGLALWYQIAADCEVVLDDVLDGWRQRMARAALQNQPVPVLDASTQAPEGGAPTELRVANDSDQALQLTCRFRADSAAEAHELYHEPVVDGACAIPRGRLPGPTFDYQLGFSPSGEEQWVYHPWVRDVLLD